MPREVLSVKVEGLETVDQRLKALDNKLSTKIVKQALRAGAKVTQRAAFSTVPVLSGKLKSAIKVRAGKARKGYASIIVGVGDKWFSGATFYGAFVEFGHKMGSRKLGDKRKQIPGEHFMEYAFEESKQQAMDTIIETSKRLLEEAEREIAGGK